MPENPFVLIADDDAFFGMLLKGGLKEGQFDAQTVENGEEAMKVIHTRRPDILVLDLVMPIKDGFEVLKEIKADSKLKGMRIVVLTNLAQEEDRNRALELGVTDFILKSSISMAGLVEKIKGILK